MWWQLFIVLVATAGASADEHEAEVHDPNCISLVHLECDRNDESKPNDFPGTAEELEEFCKYALNFFECTENALSNCKENDDFKRYMRDLAVNARRICTEDLIYTAVSAILPCFKKNKDTITHCTRTFNVDSFPKLLIDIGINGIEEHGDTPSGICLGALYTAGCTAASTGQHCGDGARDVLVDIFLGFDTPFEECPAGLKEKLPEIAQAMQAEAEKAESVEETMKRKK